MAITNLGNSTPQWWRNLSRSLHTFFYSVIALIASSNYFSEKQEDGITLALGIAGALVLLISTTMGMKPEEVIEQQVQKIEKKKEKEEQKVVEAANK